MNLVTETTIDQLKDWERRLLYLMRIKQVGNFKLSVANGIVTIVEVAQPDCYNITNPGAVSLDPYDIKLFELVRFLNFGTVTYNIVEGRFSRLTDSLSFLTGGHKTYKLELDDVERELEFITGEKYNLAKIPLVGATKKRVSKQKSILATK